jgi:hypothetical protein
LYKVYWLPSMGILNLGKKIQINKPCLIYI